MSNSLQMYVQDTVEAVADRLLVDVRDRNGHIYICGGVTMAHGVADALREAFVKRGLTPDKAKGLLDKLKVSEAQLINKSLKALPTDVFYTSADWGEIP